MHSPTWNREIADGAVLASGCVLGGYRIVERCGLSTTDIPESGFTLTAAMFRGEELSSGLSVVLKVFRCDASAEDPFAKTLMREAMRVASFVHPNVVSVYDVGLDHGCLYIAMQAVDGDTLLDRMQANRLSAAQTVDLLGPVAGALDAAHAVGLVHGDVTPGTILIDADGRPHLAAFSAVRSASGIRTGVRLKEINYASPERLRGLALTGASDVYSLTAVLYLCLTGEAPFPLATGAAIEQAHFEASAPTLESFTPVCPALDRVIACGMAKDPADRYQQAQALIQETAEAVADLPSEALRNAPAFVRARRRGRVDSAMAARATADRIEPVAIAGADVRRARSEPWTGGRILAAYVLACVAMVSTIVFEHLARIGASGAPAARTSKATTVRPASAGALTVYSQQRPDAQLDAALSHALAPVSASRQGLDGLRAGSLGARAASAMTVARLERDAASSLAGLATPAGDRQAVAALRGSLVAEAAAFAALGRAGARNNRSAYAGARLMVLAASKLLGAAAEVFTRQGFVLPPLPALYLVSPPSSPSPSRARTSPVQRPTVAPAAPQQPTAPVTRQSAAPVSQQPAAPVISQTAVSPSASAPASSSPTESTASKPPSPAVVVVPAGSTTSSSPTPPSTVVVVPGG